MWHRIETDKDISELMSETNWFHDSCLKELHYISGAYVDGNYAMYPFNDRRCLKVVFQTQNHKSPVIELMFEGLITLRMKPTPETYTCEIQSASVFFQENKVCWTDSDDLAKEKNSEYEGTIIISSKLRYRIVNCPIGDKEIFAEKNF